MGIAKPGLSRVRQTWDTCRQGMPTSGLPFWQNARSGSVYAHGTPRMPSPDLAFFGEIANPAGSRPPDPKNAKSPSQVWHPSAEWPIRVRLSPRNPENAKLKAGILWQNGDPAASMASGPRVCQTLCQVWQTLGAAGVAATIPPHPSE